MSQIEIVNLHPDHFDALAQLQYDCFPTVDESEYFRREHFEPQCNIFPEGIFVGLDGDRVIGFASGIFIDFDFDHPQHTSKDITGDGSYSTHDSNGDYYYAADIGVHPDYRSRGIGSRFYDARKGLVRHYDKKGIVSGGILSSYVEHQHLSVHDYVNQVLAGEIYDLTLSFQLKNGFQYLGLIENYVENEADNYGTLIYWPNPDLG